MLNIIFHNCGEMQVKTKIKDYFGPTNTAKKLKPSRARASEYACSWNSPLSYTTGDNA
jgi:hypothetical protein